MRTLEDANAWKKRVGVQTCNHCEEAFMPSKDQCLIGFYYFSAYGEPHVKIFCSDDCQKGERDSDLYDTCVACGRTIATYCGCNPQFKRFCDEPLCISCWRESLLEDGTPRDMLEKCQLGQAGVFFDFGNHEALDVGYQEVPHMDCLFIGSQQAKNEFCQAALEYHDQGYDVIIAFERISTFGDEGYVTLLIRKRDEVSG